MEFGVRLSIGATPIEVDHRSKLDYAI